MKKLRLAIFTSLMTFLLLSGCNKNSESTQSITPQEKIKTDEVITISESVKIGEQIWMRQNLNIDKFRNGDSIPQVTTKAQWKKSLELKQPAWTYYDMDPTNATKYGKLYNWFAVNDPRGLAPEGQHVPSDEEWSTLAEYLNGEGWSEAALKSKTGWDFGGNKTNKSGFTALPGGNRGASGRFMFIGSNSFWWSSSESSSSHAWYRNLGSMNGDLSRMHGNKNHGYSVRCLKD
ncbi:MAG: fibrobacter succinogenes major paralogous domain-containing protein [Saccharospirillaceae bacterium]|nr:fibrobacter succinogenes major paralogous domain-containing protein [Pseudomonadales bacterium]NRB81350.1 fibrobacter succinogenes major paralogous domain-containing protein [Saccharospirillaceae bacterium]